jgi:phosphoglycolate phosphatase
VPALPPPRGLLFDKDGTLLDYHETWMPANRAVAARLSAGDADLAAELLQRGGWDPGSGRVGSGTPLAAGDLSDIAAAWAPLIPDVGDRLEEMDRTFTEAMTPVPICDLAALFDGLVAAGFVLGIATADSARGLARSLAPFGVLERTVFAAGYDSGHGRKPGPGMVHGFCAAAGLTPTDVWVIGDSPHDLAMARAAGAVAVGVLTGTSNAEELQAAGADRLLSSIADLGSDGALGIEV